MTEAELPLCPCGMVHRARDPRVHQYLLDFVVRLGPTVTVTTPTGSWLVPRVWIAFHGLRAWELPALAVRYGWSRPSRRPQDGPAGGLGP